MNKKLILLVLLISLTLNGCASLVPGLVKHKDCFKEYCNDRDYFLWATYQDKYY